MLPGIRILFAITLLSVSVLIFGLGAAAYLRSAHEHFASATMRPIEAPAVVRLEPAPATLALLRVEPETAPPLPAVKLEPPVAASPIETTPAAETAVAATTALPPRAGADQAPAAVTTAAEPAPAAASQSLPEPAVTAKAPPREVAREVAAPPIAETKIPEATAAPAPTVVAALNSDKGETPAKTASEPAPLAAAPPSPMDAPPVAAAPAPATDTLKADDKAIDAPPSKIAALAEPTATEVAPVPASEVKIPAPRADPAEVEAKRKRLLAQKQARARAAKARRLAAARARAAAQAKPAETNPFGSPSAGSTTNTRTKSGS